MAKIKVLQGLPASGKTTLAKKMIIDDPSFIRINRDDLRTMIYNYKYPDQEGLIKMMELRCALEALDKGYSIIIDGINFSQNTIDRWKDIAHSRQCEFEVKYIFCPLETCIDRDSKRPNPVGENVIRGIYDQYLNIKKQ